MVTDTEAALRKQIDLKATILKKSSEIAVSGTFKSTGRVKTANIVIRIISVTKNYRI